MATYALTRPTARALHPLGWWVWALGNAAAASQVTNWWLLLLHISAIGLVVVAKRSAHPWARSFRLYLILGVWIVMIRLVFRVLFGSTPGTVMWDLPVIALPAWVAGLQLLGPVTMEGVAAALSEGVRLAAIVISVGAANALANPKRVLKSLPASLYEVGTVLVIAVSAVPQLAESVTRVRAAQQLRAAPPGRAWNLRRTVVPVLEDALTRSMALAESMDARGYGRVTLAPSQARRSATALIVALLGICAGAYGVLDPTAPWWLAYPMLALGITCAAWGLMQAGRGVARTTYRPDAWGWPELVVSLGAAGVFGVAFWLARTATEVAFPAPGWLPVITLGCLPWLVLVLLPLVVSKPQGADNVAA